MSDTTNYCPLCVEKDAEIAKLQKVVEYWKGELEHQERHAKSAYRIQNKALKEQDKLREVLVRVGFLMDDGEDTEAWKLIAASAPCPACNGIGGFETNDDSIECGHCDGSGVYEYRNIRDKENNG